MLSVQSPPPRRAARAPAAGVRARTRLHGRTHLRPDTALAIVRDVAATTKGGGRGLFTAGVATARARVRVGVEHEEPGRLALSLTGAGRTGELGRFSATVEVHHGQTVLTVGGLERFETGRPRVGGFLSSRPATVLGYAGYERFLKAVQASIVRADPLTDVLLETREG